MGDMPSRLSSLKEAIMGGKDNSGLRSLCKVMVGQGGGTKAAHFSTTQFY